MRHAATCARHTVLHSGCTYGVGHLHQLLLQVLRVLAHSEQQRLQAVKRGGAHVLPGRGTLDERGVTLDLGHSRGGSSHAQRTAQSGEESGLHGESAGKVTATVGVFCEDAE